MSKRLPEKFLKERYEHDAKYFRVYDHYRPNYKQSIITRKFYSSQISSIKPDPELVEKVKLARDSGPKDRQTWPETTNQWYGWFSEPIVQENRNDSRFFFPRQGSNMIKHELNVNREKKKDPKFTGTPFRI